MAPCRVAAGPRAPCRQAARWPAGRCPEPPGWGRGGWAPPALLAARAAGLARFAQDRAGAGRRPTVLPGRRAGCPGRDVSALAAARSGREPDVAVRRVRPRARGGPPVAPKVRPGQGRGLPAVTGGAAARAWRARLGRPGALPAVRTAGAARSGSRRPDAPARPGGRRAVDPVSGGRPGVPARLVEDVPARPAAGGADPAGRHRPTGPGQAGAMARRNCPAKERWRGSGCRAGAGSWCAW
jgi:hypothetical protein